MKYSASGKLMLFGEYLVLRGATCLAIPLRYGQRLKVTPRQSGIVWTSMHENHTWFHAEYSHSLDILSGSDSRRAQMIAGLLGFIRQEKPEMFDSGFHFVSSADFSPDWGFGTSSTLVSLLAQWSGIDAYRLLKNSFGGSGYDVACANADNPILYQIEKGVIKEVVLNPSVTSRLMFVYSGRKQGTAAEISRFEEAEVSATHIETMNKLINEAVTAESIEVFEKSIKKSEALLSGILKMKPVGEKYFSEYPFPIKSLGAWGGDFFMASFRDEKLARQWFSSKGYPIQFTYAEIIKQK